MPKRNKNVEINIKADGKNWKWKNHRHECGSWGDLNAAK